MKLQYKKAVLFTLISTMGIGIVTLSVAPNHQAKETTNNQAINETMVTPVVSQVPVTITPTQPISTPQPTALPTPTPLPVYPLETDGYPKITELFRGYYKAKLNCDLKSFQSYLSNPDKAPTKEMLKKNAQFKEEYKNIKCYVKKGFTEGTYIVFVYYEVKFINIKTSAPAVTQFYVITDQNGKLKIYSDDLDQTTEEYYNDRKHDPDVEKLSDATNKKLEKAIKKDKDFQIFWVNLTKR